MILRELVTQLRFELRGLREAEQAFRGLQAKARQVGDIKFRSTGVQQAEAAIARLRGMARSAALDVPARPPVGGPGGGLSAMGPVRIAGVDAARDALAGLRVMAQSVSAAVVGIGGAMGVKALVAAGDEYTSALNQIRTSLQGVQGDADAVYERLYAAAKSTGVAVQAGVQGFTRIQSAVADLGGTPEQVLQIVEGLQQAGVVAGAKSTDIAEATRQLGQGLSGSSIFWEELGVIQDRLPNLVRELAKEMGMDLGKFKKMAGDGKLLTKDVFPALIKISGKFREQFDQMTPTFSRSVGQMKVVWTRFLADLDAQVGLSQALARGLTPLTEWVDGLRAKLPVVRRFVNEIGGIKSVLEVVAISAGLATAAFFRFGLSLIVPSAVVLGILAVGTVLQDLWYWVKGRRGSLAQDLFGDFEPVRQRAVAALDGVKAKLRELRDEVVTGLGFKSTGELFDDVQRRFTAFAETTKREWEAVRSFFASDATAGAFADTVRGMGDNARAMWEVVGPIIRGLVGGPSEMAKEWAGFAALFKDPLALVGAYFDDLSNRVARVAERLRDLLGIKIPEGGFGAGLSALSKEGTAETRGKMMDGIFGPGGTDRRRLFGPSTTPAAPGAAPAPTNDLGLPGISPMSYDPMGYMRDLPSRMYRAQTIAASYAPSVRNEITIHATGVSGAEVAAAAQSGVGRAMDRSLGESQLSEVARMIGFNSSLTEMAAT